MNSPVTAPVAPKPLRLEDLPRPPEGALRVLAACGEEHAEISRIAPLVAADPTLVADLLHVVNSPYFGLGQNIGSVGRAVTLLGLNALRNRVVCLTVRAATRASDLPPAANLAFVEDSLRRAVAARTLAASAGLAADDAFTAGLLQDFGLLALLVLHPQIALTHWQTLRSAPPDARLALEMELFGVSHDVVLGELAVNWHLPSTLVAAVRAHHQPAPDDAMAGLLAAADRVTAVFASDGDGTTLEIAKTDLERRFGLAGDAAHAWLAALPALVQQAASSLGMSIPAQAELDTLTARLNTRLADDNLSYQEMNWRLQQALRERDELAARLSAELEIAREIQCSLLPDAAPARHPIWARNVAARELSGDFYDYFTTADGRLLFNLGDVSGKGLTAALLMTKTCSLFRCLGRRLDRLEEIVGIINDEICETTVRGMFVTMIAGMYDAQSEQVEILCAGHPPPLLLRHGQGLVQVPGTDMPPLGIVPGMAFETRSLSLNKASLYLYSDGVSEAVDANGDELGLRGLARLIAGACNLPPASRIDNIIDAVAITDCKRRDDITLAVLDPAGLH